MSLFVTGYLLENVGLESWLAAICKQKESNRCITDLYYQT